MLMNPNLVLMQQEINIRIGCKAPVDYMGSLMEGIQKGEMRLGAITSQEELSANLEENAIPEILIDGQLENFNEFLSQRRQMMSKLIERYYRRL